jgi:hypothetical protein
MLTYRKSTNKIHDYETVFFYGGRITRSYCHNCSFYSCIIAGIAKFQATGQSRPLQLEYQTVDLWFAYVRDRKPGVAL